MKLNKIILDEEISLQKGLSEIDLDRLTNVIALVGKNGSGKTRFLDLIEQNILSLISINRFLDNSISNPPKILNNSLNQLLPFKEYLLSQEKINILSKKVSQNSQDENLKSQLNSAQTQFKIVQREYTQKQGPNARNELQNINNRLNNINGIISKINQNYIRRIRHEDIRQLQDAISDNKNEQHLSFDSLIESVAENVDYNVITAINRSSLNFLKKLPHQLAYDFMDCMGDANKYEKRVAHKRYKLLKQLCADFLNKELTWERKSSDKKLTDQGVQSIQSGVWKLDDRLFNYNELSDGEKTLLSYILLFFLIEQNPNLTVGESILIIDEPELHLHPDSEIDLIDGIRKTISPNGQLFIATHSINILSSLQLDEIFMVRKGSITHPSRKTPGESLAELMSIDERIVKLKEFLSSASEWSYVNFMTQCLTEPDVVAHSSKNDPQYVAFKNTLNNNINQKTNLLLDFGAGKGRLFELIKSDTEFDSKFQYSALEPEKKYHKDLKALGINNVIQSYKELSESKYDIVILCNVLHEIPLNEWISILNKITKALKENGYLLIIEDKLLPKGERIGEIGFLILDDDSLMELFGLNQIPISFVDKSKVERILCYAIPRNQISQLNKNKLVSALQKLEINSLEKIKELRKENNNNMDIKHGRLNGFFSQQYINSRLAIESLINNE